MPPPQGMARCSSTGPNREWQDKCLNAVLIFVSRLSVCVSVCAQLRRWKERFRSWTEMLRADRDASCVLYFFTNTIFVRPRFGWQGGSAIQTSLDKVVRWFFTVLFRISVSAGIQRPERYSTSGYHLRRCLHAWRNGTVLLTRTGHSTFRVFEYSYCDILSREKNKVETENLSDPLPFLRRSKSVDWIVRVVHSLSFWSLRWIMFGWAEIFRQIPHVRVVCSWISTQKIVHPIKQCTKICQHGTLCNCNLEVISTEQSFLSRSNMNPQRKS